ncbi:hypothetical protein PRELSG_0011800 [Plasmodium relictum]|uniref:Gametocyte associated protein n=1 Tax=Plasmodium relictum TaxID=85471 RepID=A0A1J1GKL5_PLARL|nr:hypothetical protein PRELSG_0011800 [Plasmodium relictum]CRG85425.1 hypothetical protein PRELSG_0011800 [Plasmodium relictum]
MKTLKVLYFFSVLYFSLWMTLLYKVNLFVTISNDILHKFDLKVCHKKERNLAEGNSSGLNRKRKYDCSLTCDESLSLSGVSDVEFLSLKLSMQKVVDSSGNLDEDAISNIRLVYNTVSSVFKIYRIEYSEEKAANMALRIISRLREMFSDGPLTNDEINSRLKNYMLENVLSYNLLKDASVQRNEEDRNSVICNIDYIKRMIITTFNLSHIVLQDNVVTDMAFRISESVQDLFDELYPRE